MIVVGLGVGCFGGNGGPPSVLVSHRTWWFLYWRLEGASDGAYRIVVLSYQSARLIGITAGEAKNPVSCAARWAKVWRILIFYVRRDFRYRHYLPDRIKSAQWQPY